MSERTFSEISMQTLPNLLHFHHSNKSFNLESVLGTSISTCPCICPEQYWQNYHPLWNSGHMQGQVLLEVLRTLSKLNDLFEW